MLLLERCLERDKVFWDRFVERFSKLVYYSIYKTTRFYGDLLSPDDIEDIHNSIFLSFIENDCRKLRQYSGRCKLSNWIKVISINQTIDILRKRHHLVRLDAAVKEDRLHEESQPSETETPETHVERREEMKRLESIIANLKPKDRLLVALLFFKEIPYEQIASLYSTSINNIYSRKNRLMKHLAREMTSLKKC